MIDMKITGDTRDIANAAWISTLDENKTNTLSNERVLKVVNFLIDENHTSPLEAVTITTTFFPENPEEEALRYSLPPYLENIYAKTKFESSGQKIIFSIDLLNFLKVTNECGKDNFLWKKFKELRPELSKICSKFRPLDSKIITFDASRILGHHNMKVELIKFHDANDDMLSRATWRIKCPLAIATQILRHRKGSYNVVSGRYRTIHQELMNSTNDCREIFNKFGISIDDYMSPAQNIINHYETCMASCKKAYDDKLISNAEYKRIREYARFVLPEGRLTEMYVTYYLDDFYKNYHILRDSIHAQIEHVWTAHEMFLSLEEQKNAKV